MKLMNSYFRTALASALNKPFWVRKSLGRNQVSAYRVSPVAAKSTNGNYDEQRLSHRLDGLDKPTVWEEFTPLALDHQAVNLGQGFPDWEPPKFVIDAMHQSVLLGGVKSNQYARSAAHMPLAVILAEEYTEKFNIGRPIDPVTEIATAVGCTQAFYCAMQGLLNPLDEVLLMEPAFDIYSAQVRMAGGVPKFIPLHQQPVETPSKANDVFHLDMDELKSSITPQTKILVLNTPHNPTGKMFSKDELEQIAEIVELNPQLTVIADEVYEYIVFDKNKSPHVHFASLPGMYERTLTLSSSGKTFSCTGWKVGWAVGPPSLIRAVASVQQWVNFSCPTPTQDAIAISMVKAREPYEHYKNYYDFLAASYTRKRDLLVDALTIAGINPIIPAGTFFILGETSRLSDQIPETYLKEVTKAMPSSNPIPRDWAMSRWLTKDVGVCTIPPSAFYSLDTLHLAATTLRFAFCKRDETIVEARKRFSNFFG